MPMRYRLRRPSAFFLVKEREEMEEEDMDVVVGLESNGGDVDMDMDHRNEDDHNSKVDQVGDDGYYDQDEGDDDDSDEDDLPPYSIRSSHSVASEHRFSDVESVLMAVSRGEIKLRKAEGLRFAYIDDMMFIDGEVGTVYVTYIDDMILILKRKKETRNYHKLKKN